LEKFSTNDPQKIGSLILETLNRMGYGDRIHRQSAVTGWSDLVGEVIADETKALKIDNKTLVVKVHRAAWRQQLTFLKDEILKKIETALGKGVVEDIRFI
jgi:predicted nucleic acid-binding Zn ribbon protein